MIKVLNTSQIKELDAHTIKTEPIASIELMERACVAFVSWLIPRFDTSNSIQIICGTGNNGGDGLGIARLLSLRGYRVEVVIVRGSSSESTDFTKNYKRLPDKIKAQTIQESVTPELPEGGIIIDALFGSGLSRSLDGAYARVVSLINQTKATRIAVDIPSGLLADSHSDGISVQAHHTVTFQLPKLSFLLLQYSSAVGEWHSVDIGLNQSFISTSSTKNFVVDESSIQTFIQSRKRFSHKGDFGHSLIVAGSHGKFGANILATRAALRAGSGLVTSVVPKCGYLAIQSAVPEAMVITDPDDNILTYLPDITRFNAVGVGPGIGTDKKTVGFLNALLDYTTFPCVIDADALNILSEHSDLQNLVAPNSILTPHPGEFRRLAGPWKNDFERLELQRSLASRLKSIIVLKGAFTSIALPNGEVYFNTTGNPAMATGGSGDVLTGILTALLAQKYSPDEAAILGVYLHGMAGDLAAVNRQTIIASDIIEQIPIAWKKLTSSPELA